MRRHIKRPWARVEARLTRMILLRRDKSIVPQTIEHTSEGSMCGQKSFDYGQLMLCGQKSFDYGQLMFGLRRQTSTKVRRIREVE